MAVCFKTITDILLPTELQVPELGSKHETLCDDLVPFAVALVTLVSLKLPHVHERAWRLLLLHHFSRLHLPEGSSLVHLFKDPITHIFEFPFPAIT